MNKKLIFVMTVAVVYIAGVISGALVVRHVAGRHGFMHPGVRPQGAERAEHGERGKAPEQRMVDRFAKKLNLTDEQKTRIVQILSDRKKDMEKTRDEFKARTESVIDSVNKSIRAVLTEEQKKIFDKIIKERPKMPGFHGRGHGEGLGGPEGAGLPPREDRDPR